VDQRFNDWLAKNNVKVRKTSSAFVISTRLLSVAVTVISLTAVPAIAEENEKEPLAMIELGGASDWSFNSGSGLGPLAGVEFEPIKNWLEIEADIGCLLGNGSAGLETSLVFKKPFDLSDKVELEIGAGPQWTQRINGEGKPGVEFAAELLFWPARDRAYAWFVEPNYTYSFGSEREQSLGLSVGLLIPIRAK
jgi:hypothetical protein